MAWVCWMSCCSTRSPPQPSPLPHLASGPSSASQTPLYALVSLLPPLYCLLCHLPTLVYVCCTFVTCIRLLHICDLSVVVTYLMCYSVQHFPASHQRFPLTSMTHLHWCLLLPPNQNLLSNLVLHACYAFHLHLGLCWKACSVSGLD